MAAAKNKYFWHDVLVNAWTTYSLGNMNLIKIFIEIKGTPSEWFLLRYVNSKPEMRRGPRDATHGTEQLGPELEKEKENLGRVEVEKDGKIIAPFPDYDSFWEKIDDRGE